MTDTEKLAKTRKGLRLCSRDTGETIGCLLDCPYEYEDGCRRVMMRDALELLPEEPRLVTREDFQRAPAWDGVLPCWKENRKPTRRNGWVAIVYGKALQDTETGMVRYWTGVPTEAQRREMAWPGA